MAQADPTKEVSTVKGMNERLLLLSSNKMTHYFEEWTTASGILKKIYCLCKNLMLLIDPLNSTVPRNYGTPKKH